jgi:hypothetical protein
MGYYFKMLLNDSDVNVCDLILHVASMYKYTALHNLYKFLYILYFFSYKHWEHKLNRFLIIESTCKTE